MTTTDRPTMREREGLLHAALADVVQSMYPEHGLADCHPGAACVVCRSRRLLRDLYGTEATPRACACGAPVSTERAGSDWCSEDCGEAHGADMLGDQIRRTA